MNQVSLYVTKGAQEIFDLTFTESDGDPFNLTGFTIYMSVKAAADDASPALIEKDSGVVGEIDVVSAAGGTATLTINPADTSSLATGQYWYDVWVSSSATTKKPLIKVSAFNVTGRVTEI